MTAQTIPAPHHTDHPTTQPHGLEAKRHGTGPGAQIAGLLLSLAGAAILLGLHHPPKRCTPAPTPPQHRQPPRRLRPPNSVVLRPRRPSSTSPCWSPGHDRRGASYAYRALGVTAVLIPTPCWHRRARVVGIFPTDPPSPAHPVRLHRLLAGVHRHRSLGASDPTSPFPLPLDGARHRRAGRDRARSRRLPQLVADGGTGRGWPRALDRVPGRPVAGGLRELPDGSRGRATAGGRRTPAVAEISVGCSAKAYPDPASQARPRMTAPAVHPGTRRFSHGVPCGELLLPANGPLRCGSNDPDRCMPLE